MNLVAKLVIGFLLLVICGLVLTICGLVGVTAFNTRHRVPPKDYSVVKRDLLELQQSSHVSVDSAAFTMTAFSDPVRFGKSLQQLHNDIKLLTAPPGDSSKAALAEVFLFAETLHQQATHQSGPNKFSYSQASTTRNTLVAKCETAFQSLASEEHP